MKIDVLLDVKTTLGEGPLWDVDLQRLFFVDLADGRIFSCTANGTEIRAWDVPGKVGAIALRKDGSGAVIALDNTFSLLDFRTGEIEKVVEIESDKPNNRLNDGKTDRRGRFFAGSMDMSEESASGALYRLDCDFTVHEIDRGFVVSNGPCFSPDDRTFYFHDSWAGEIWAYDYDLETGNLADRRVFADVDQSDGGAADGSTVDAEGFLWNALVYAGKLVRFTPDGCVDRVIELPVKKVTSVNFGGPNMDILYVTSMAKPPLPRFPEDGVLRGSLFAITGLGVEGMPEPRFGT